MHCYRLLLAPFALVAALAMPAAAQAPQSWTQVGALSCQVDPSVGFVIVGHQSMRCLFTPNTSQEREAYAAALNTVGLSVGISAGGVLGWAVFSPTAGLPLGALAGEYVGVSGDVGIGLCAGANVLRGRSNRTIALQPISLQGSIALNVVAGLSSLLLRPLPL